MPAYNAEKFIKNAVESILNQTYRNFEFIIIDDGSQDKTLDIIKLYNDPRIKLIENKINIGIVESLNKGIRISTGEYIARMDADDISINTRFELQIAEFKKNTNLILCGSWYTIMYESKIISTVKLPISDIEIKSRLLFNNQFCHPSIMMKSEIAKFYKYNDNHIGCEDYGLWIKLIDKGEFINIPLSLLKYRIHYNNISLKKDKKKDIAIYRIITENIYFKYHYSINKSDFTKFDIKKILSFFNKNKNSKYEKDEFLKHINLRNLPIKYCSLFLIPSLMSSFFKVKFYNFNLKFKLFIIGKNIFHNQ